MPKINVLLANDHLGIGNSIHGVGRLFSLWIQYFDKTRFNMIVCILRKKDKIGEYVEEELKEMGVNIKFLGRGKFDPFTCSDFIKIIKENKIDIMHLQAYGASTFGRMAGIITGIPTIVHAHDDDSNYPLYQRLADLLLSKFTTKAIAVSESVKESCIKNRKIPGDKILVMHNGIPLEKFGVLKTDEIEQEKDYLGIDSNAYVIGTIAKLRKEKGIEYLLEAMKILLEQYSKIVLLIVGDGPLRDELEYYSRQLKINNKVIFTGYRRNIPLMLSIFDIYVMPSLTEGSPMALLEAMVTGKPIIATNVGGIREILKNGKTGILINPKDPNTLADMIFYLLKNKDIAKELGMKAKEESKKYDINFYVRRLEDIYYKLALSR